MSLDKRAYWTLVYFCSFFTSLDTMTCGLIGAAVADTGPLRFMHALLAVTREMADRGMLT